MSCTVNGSGLLDVITRPVEPRDGAGDGVTTSPADPDGDGFTVWLVSADPSAVASLPVVEQLVTVISTAAMLATTCLTIIDLYPRYVPNYYEFYTLISAVGGTESFFSLR